MRREFILVAGPNAAGKTTVIENNRALLESSGFRIIIPDDILKYATSHTDVTEVIREHVDEALIEKKNIVLETPFQFKGLSKTIGRIKVEDYNLSIYQVFVADAEESISRVKDRFKESGRFINSEEVKSNFDANMKNVAEQFGRFDHSYFIDNSTNKGMKLAAEFEKGKLIRFHPSDNFYLRNLFKLSAKAKKINATTLKIILANKHFPGLLPKRKSKRRLKL